MTCPYCKRPTDDEGAIYHEGNCPGLADISMCRMEHKYLIDLLRDARDAVTATAEAECVCSGHHPRCKYCAPYRSLIDRITETASEFDVQICQQIYKCNEGRFMQDCPVHGDEVTARETEVKG